MQRVKRTASNKAIVQVIVRLICLSVVILLLALIAHNAYLQHQVTELRNEVADSRLASDARIEELSEEVEQWQRYVRTLQTYVSSKIEAAAEAQAQSEAIIYTDEDVDLVARLVATEAGGEPFDGQKAVAQCVIDRAAAFDMSISEVIYQKNQFATPYAGDMSAFPRSRAAAEAVMLDGERVFDTPVIFFYNPGTSDPGAKSWLETKPYIDTICCHVFRGM